MALSEGLKGFVNFITKGFNDGDEDVFTDLVDTDGDTYETDGTLALDSMYGTNVTAKPVRSFERESKVATHPNSYKSGEVMVIEPRSFSEDSMQLIKYLQDGRTIVLNLHLLDKEQAQRLVDFVSGATQALSGHQQKIADTVFIFAPTNISISADSLRAKPSMTDGIWGQRQY